MKCFNKSVSFFLLVFLPFELLAARHLVVFKSERGFQAMQSYLLGSKYKNVSFSAGQNKKQILALPNVHSLVLGRSERHLVDNLKNHPEVLLIEKERWIPLPPKRSGVKKIKKSFQDNSRRRRPPTITEPPSDLAEFQAGQQTPWGIVAVAAPQVWGISAAGANARVMVLDTGVDENHPALERNFEKGRNFFISDEDEMLNESAYQDTDGHGTHCAGTILGDYNSATGFTGVAPRAKLLAGRVCGEDGCSNISVVQGLDWAISERVDVIILSLGGDYFTPSEKQAIERVEKAGITVIAASGNSADEPDYSHDKKQCPGDSRYFPNKCGVGFPAAYPTVVAVGALTPQLERAQFSQWGPELDLVAPGVDVRSSVPVGLGRESHVSVQSSGGVKKIKSSVFSGAEQTAVAISGELVSVPGVGRAEDFSQVNVVGKIALVSRGEIKFAEKMKHAIQAQAKALVIYNNTDGLMQGDIADEDQILDYPVVMIEQVTGLELTSRLNSAEPLRLELSILTADYELYEGTSMAAPHVSGVVALMKSANRRLSPVQIRRILSESAQVLNGPNQTNQLGAGLVSAERAVRRATSH